MSKNYGSHSELSIAVQPHTGRTFVQVCERRTCQDYAEFMAALVEAHCPAGGQLLLIREIRSETERIENAVQKEIGTALELVSKMSVGKSIDDDQFTCANSSKLVREIYKHLHDLKIFQEEQKMSWGAERKALLEQSKRQSELLVQLASELKLLSEQHEAVQALIEKIYSAESTLNNELQVAEANIAAMLQAHTNLAGQMAGLG